MAEPTPGVVPVVLQTGDPSNSVTVIRGSLAGGQDIILRSGAVTADLTLPNSGNLLSDGEPIPALIIEELYIGPRARFVALLNGLRLEVMDDTGIWKPQNEWTEGAPAPADLV